MPVFHHSVAVDRCRYAVAVVPFGSYVAVARENGIAGNVFPLTAFEQ